MTKDLTEQYTVGGTLICAEGSYVYTENGIEKVHYCQVGCITERVTPKANIIAPVPSYEEWKEKNETSYILAQGIIERNKEIDKLKELLKECREVAEFTKTIVNKHKWFNEVITKIDKVLK